MTRYFLNISYIGTKFSGVQKNKNAAGNATVQGALEGALALFRPLNPLIVFMSSRTDAGVHALHSTLHVDLEKPPGREIPPEHITNRLNKEFFSWSIPIRVLSTELVPDTFNARFDAIKRTYLYRIAVSKERFDKVTPFSRKSKDHRPPSELFTLFQPMEEYQRCLFVINRGFEIERAIEASKLFMGRHDFRSFMGGSKEERTKHAFFAVRKIEHFSIEPGKTFCTDFNRDRALETYHFWDFKISAKAFVNKQIRRMVATLIDVGHGHRTNRDVYEMLTIPSMHTLTSTGSIIPPHGLYLAEVLYDENSKKLPVSHEFKVSEIEAEHQLTDSNKSGIE